MVGIRMTTSMNRNRQSEVEYIVKFSFFVFVHIRDLALKSKSVL